MRFIDTHSHLQFPQYDNDRAAVISRMRKEGIGTIVVGVDYLSSKKGVELAACEDFFWATIGVHPTDSEASFDAASYDRLRTSRVVAVGECGLDYFRAPRDAVYERQSMLFRTQIEYALAHDLALMLHVRPSAGSEDAHADALEILEEYRGKGMLRGTSHFFTGSLQSAERYWDLGLATSFPGVITFAREYDEVVRAAPQELVIAETDAPYAAPLPYRGKRNEPSYVSEVVKVIAEIRGEDRKVVEKQLVENAERIFRLA